MLKIFNSLVFVLVIFTSEIYGHGMVMNPPNRASMWRFGFPVKINYDDNANFCGGQQVQWEINGGHCGACGDDYRIPQPRANENTGLYGSGIIGKTYNHSDIIEIAVLITANHKGYFTFSLCELTDPDIYEKEECFTNLKLANGDDIYVLPSSDTGYYMVDVQLPIGFTCERCVLRWQYTAGNSWGICPDGTGKVGCGPQENFRTCSDIRIL